MEEKQKLIEYAKNLYLMNLSKRAFEGLKFNMVPRKMFIRRLVEKYRKEQLKMKTIKSLKMLITRKQYIQH